MRMKDLDVLQFAEGPSSSGITIRGASAPSSNGGYLRSQSLDIPRAEPGSATARRLNLLRCSIKQGKMLQQ